MDQLRTPIFGAYVPYAESSIPVGAYQVSGNVSRLGVAGRYWVYLYERASRRHVRSCLSNADGSYLFKNVAYTTYFVVSLDHTADPVNAAISDYVTAEPMDE